MQDNVLTATEAAEALGVSFRQLSRYVQVGLLTPREPTDNNNGHGTRTYWAADISATREIMAKKPSLELAIFEARRAAIETRAMRNELERMRFVLGLDIPTISTDRDTLMALLLRTEDALRTRYLMDSPELLEWARVLHGLNEAHFEALHEYTDNEEPWKPFLALGNDLCSREQHLETSYDLELHNVYRLLNASLRRARQTAFFYIYRRYGRNRAHREIRMNGEDSRTPHEDVIALSFNTNAWMMGNI